MLVARLCLILCDSMSLPGPSVRGIFQGKYTGMSCHLLLHGIFLTQKQNLGGPRFVRTLHHDPSSLVALHRMAHSFTELDKAVFHVIRLVSFL